MWPTWRRRWKFRICLRYSTICHRKSCHRKYDGNMMGICQNVLGGSWTSFEAIAWNIVSCISYITWVLDVLGDSKGARMSTDVEPILKQFPGPMFHHVSSCFIMFQHVSWVFHEYFIPFPRDCSLSSPGCQVHLPVHPWQSQKASFVRQIEEPGAILQQETLHHARRITEELVPILAESEKRILQMCNRPIDINEIHINWHDLSICYYTILTYINIYYTAKVIAPKSLQKLSQLRKRSGALGAGYCTQHTLNNTLWSLKYAWCPKK